MRDVFKDVVEKNSTPNYIDNKADFITHFKDQYGAKWTGKAAAALAGTTDTKSKEYRAAIRQFQGDRLAKEPTKGAVKEHYKQAGEKLPPTSRTPKGNITVTIKGKQDSGRRGGYRERTISVELSGSDAYSFVNDPNFRTVWDAGDYPDFGEDDGDGGSGSMYEMTVA